MKEEKPFFFHPSSLNVPPAGVDQKPAHQQLTLASTSRSIASRGTARRAGIARRKNYRYETSRSRRLVAGAFGRVAVLWRRPTGQETSILQSRHPADPVSKVFSMSRPGCEDTESQVASGSTE